ncbi:MAG: hypothetical protein HN352_14690 [Bacteroidetes bacterium]|jgi:hypothetical protein|nr:hypothetical protein [Bacteroidota bacterium]MBT3749093.1 hypothetical protein [Bacteroidota bacterium]MBT4401724.1 hypothetical protein [Bacteroidota bacterium]MBT4409170.1 hypothetical protein [Bacteroidota bacterium]MBT5428028.1 hypothetical protein [Bacteroidota bacterium]
MNRIFLNTQIVISSILLLILLPSCDKSIWEDPCSNCYEDKPTEGLLAINVNPSDDYDLLEIRIIKGRLEKGEEFIRDTLSLEYVEYWVDVGSYYTVEAHYLVDGKHYLAVDGDRVSIYLDDSSCDVACWRPNDGEVDCILEL